MGGTNRKRFGFFKLISLRKSKPKHNTQSSRDAKTTPSSPLSTIGLGVDGIVISPGTPDDVHRKSVHQTQTFPQAEDQLAELCFMASSANLSIPSRLQSMVSATESANNNNSNNISNNTSHNLSDHNSVQNHRLQIRGPSRNLKDMSKERDTTSRYLSRFFDSKIDLDVISLEDANIETFKAFDGGTPKNATVESPKLVQVEDRAQLQLASPAFSSPEFMIGNEIGTDEVYRAEMLELVTKHKLMVTRQQNEIKHLKELLKNERKINSLLATTFSSNYIRHQSTSSHNSHDQRSASAPSDSRIQTQALGIPASTPPNQAPPQVPISSLYSKKVRTKFLPMEITSTPNLVLSTSNSADCFSPKEFHLSKKLLTATDSVSIANSNSDSDNLDFNNNNNTNINKINNHFPHTRLTGSVSTIETLYITAGVGFFDTSINLPTTADTTSNTISQNNTIIESPLSSASSVMSRSHGPHHHHQAKSFAHSVSHSHIPFSNPFICGKGRDELSPNVLSGIEIEDLIGSPLNNNFYFSTSVQTTPEMEFNSKSDHL